MISLYCGRRLKIVNVFVLSNLRLVCIVFRFTKLGVISAKYRNRCETWLFVECQTSIRIVKEFDNRSREIGGIIIESNEFEASVAWNSQRNADFAVQWQFVTRD